MTADARPPAMEAALRALGLQGKAAPPQADGTSGRPEGPPEDDQAGFDRQLQAFGLRRLGRLWPITPTYPRKQLMEEVAFIAYHFHWPLKEILALEHGDRRSWIAEISSINERMNSGDPRPAWQA